MKTLWLPAPRVRTAGSVRIERLTWAGLAGTIAFAVSAFLMHFIQPELSPVDDAVRYYLNGKFGWLLGLGLVLLGSGSLCLLWAIRRIAGDTGVFGSWALALWGLGAVAGGIFPPDQGSKPPSIPGMIHANVAMVAFLSFPVAALLLTRKIVPLSRSRKLRVLLRASALACALLLLAFFASLVAAFPDRTPYLLGLAERVLLLAYLGWLITAAMAVRNVAIFWSDRPSARV
jgi:hypothetical membrane protein